MSKILFYRNNISDSIYYHKDINDIFIILIEKRSWMIYLDLIWDLMNNKKHSSYWQMLLNWYIIRSVMHHSIMLDSAIESNASNLKKDGWKMSKRFGYIHGISNNKNIHKQKFSLTIAGINNNNIFIDYDDSNKEDNNLSKTWNRLLKAMHIGDQLFINNLNNLISKNDMYNINNLSDELLAIRTNVFSIVQKNVEVISLGDEIKINKNNVKDIFNIMYILININNNYLHDKSNITNSKINRYSNYKRDNSSRISGNKFPLYKNIYLYVKQGHKKTEAAKKFHISDSTVYRIIHDFDNLNFFDNSFHITT